MNLEVLDQAIELMRRVWKDEESFDISKWAREEEGCGFVGCLGGWMAHERIGGLRIYKPILSCPLIGWLGEGADKDDQPTYSFLGLASAFGLKEDEESDFTRSTLGRGLGYDDYYRRGRNATALNVLARLKAVRRYGEQAYVEKICRRGSVGWVFKVESNILEG